MEIKSTTKISKSHILLGFKNEDSFEFFDKKNNKEIKNKISSIINKFSFKLENNQTKEITLENQHIILLCMTQNPTSEELRITGNTIFNLTKGLDKISLELPFKEDEIKSCIEAIMLSDYSFDKYKTKLKPNNNTTLLIENIKPAIISEAKKLIECVKITRDLVNENSDVATPELFENIAKGFAKKHNLKTKILNEKQIIKENLGLLHAVGKGSSNPPRLIVLEYIGDSKSKEKLALVGKGITFDTGGTNLKPSGYVEDMKLDMAGAATAYGTFKYLVEEKIKKNLVLVLPCAENSISHNSYKPGDVIKGYNGISVEVLNTDAEGRLVLADALSYVQKNFKPTQIIDMATLTGACPVALGPSLIAILGNSQDTITKIYDVGEKTGERVWQLPIYDEHREMLKSTIADCKNIGGKFGGTITAAAFLEQFVEKDIKWTHLDIAGAAWFKSSKNYIPQYATGIGVRLLSHYIINNK